MYRRRVVLEIGAYRDIFDEAEDLDLFLRLAEVGRVVNMRSRSWKYREHLAKSSRAKVVRVEENIRPDPGGTPTGGGGSSSSSPRTPGSQARS